MDFTMKRRLNGKWSWSSSLPPYIILCMKLEFIEELHFKSLTYREALIMYPSPFLEKNSKVQPKNHEMIFFFCFENLISNCFLKADLNTRFIRQSNTISTFIWSINQKFSHILSSWPNSNKVCSCSSRGLVLLTTYPSFEKLHGKRSFRQKPGKPKAVSNLHS